MCALFSHVELGDFKASGNTQWGGQCQSFVLQGQVSLSLNNTNSCTKEQALKVVRR